MTVNTNLERRTSRTDHGATSSLHERFNAIADRLTRALGSFQALAGSVILVVVWGLTGPIFRFSDTWQLFINTTTTVVTFWMVFVIQNSANREAKATQLKLDEIIRALAEARNDFIKLDHAPEAVLAAKEEEFNEIVENDRASLVPESPERRKTAAKTTAAGQRLRRHGGTSRDARHLG